jgi:hypothetical protein
MKITRRPIVLSAEKYSREYGIERSIGCHLMTVVERMIERHPKMAGGKKVDKGRYHDGEPTTEALRTSGFVWERVMSAEFQHLHPKADLIFPGEMLWCMNCDDVLQGGNIGRDHCQSRRHKGIFFTPDYFINGYPTPSAHTVGEHKWTWLTSKRSDPERLPNPDGIWKWPVQLMWGAWAFDTLYGHIEAMHCHGDYVEYNAWGAPDPEAFEIDLEFTKREVEQNRVMIVTNAKAEGLL